MSQTTVEGATNLSYLYTRQLVVSSHWGDDESQKDKLGKLWTLHEVLYTTRRTTMTNLLSHTLCVTF